MNYDKKIWVTEEERDILYRHLEFEWVEAKELKDINGLIYANYLGSREETHYMLFLSTSSYQSMLERRLMPLMDDPLRQALYDAREHKN